MSCSEYTIVMLGSGGVGKSCLTLRFVTNGFSEDYDATIEDSYRKCIEVDGRTIQLEIMDTAGQEEFQVLIDGWVRAADGVMLVYDISNRTTFEEMERFYERVVHTKDTTRFPMALIGNKCDLPLAQRKVTEAEGRSLASRWSCSFLEVSARDRIRDRECFYEMVRVMRTFHSREKKPSTQREFCTIL